MYEWTYELSKKLRLRSLENREILVKCQNPMGTEPCVQSLVPKESFGAGATLFVILIFPKIVCKEFFLETKTS